ncbi:unnamed protein product [Allacma fusca]|uniref:Serpin domain-containing protein n=1 Tax=Allacma fusca TaxID=39272 RepID=A0A8J2NTZ4_9HEXA|nr:unnamed protein product [Allacma fusca]
MGEPIGAEGFSPFTMSYLLAVVHTQIWPVPTKGFSKLLHLEDQQIQNTYQWIVEQLSSDTHVILHSNVLTATKGFQTPQNVSNLKSRVSYIDYNAPNTNEAIMQINAMLSGQTFGKYYDKLVPLGGWYGTAIYNYTSGLFLNTLYFNGGWEYPFYSIGPMEFAGPNKLPFLEAYGNFNVISQPNYRALRIPLKNSSKVLILVEPRGGKRIKDFANEDFESFLELRRNKSAEEWSFRELRVRLPAFNISLRGSFSENLRNLGLKNSICAYNYKNLHTFEAFVQSTYAHLAEDKFEIASVTAASLTDIKNHQDFYHFNKNCTPQEDQINDVETTTTDNKNISLDTETTSEPSKPSASSTEDPDGMLVMESPFLWYFEDEALGIGPLVLGTVETAPLRTEPQIDKGFEWLLELEKYMYWSCPDPWFEESFKNQPC